MRIGLTVLLLLSGFLLLVQLPGVDAALAVCGDDTCDGGEDCSVCPEDCGECGGGSGGTTYCNYADKYDCSSDAYCNYLFGIDCAEVDGMSVGDVKEISWWSEYHATASSCTRKDGYEPKSNMEACNSNCDDIKVVEDKGVTADVECMPACDSAGSNCSSNSDCCSGMCEYKEDKDSYKCIDSCPSGFDWNGNDPGNCETDTTKTCYEDGPSECDSVAVCGSSYSGCTNDCSTGEACCSWKTYDGVEYGRPKAISSY